MKGVRTRKQALAEGHSPKAIREALRRGRWQRPFRGVYVMHSGKVSWRERLYAAVLAAGDRAAASGDCALTLWGLSKDEPSFLTVDIPVERVIRGRLPGVRVRRRRRHTRAVQKKVPVLGLHQTVIDAVASPRRTIDDIVILLAKACAPGKSSPAALREELAHHPNHPRRSLLAEILEAADLGLESGAEWRYITAVERPHGLPPMTPQAPLDGPAPQDHATADAQTDEANDAQPTAGTQQNESSGAAPSAGTQTAATARRRRRGWQGRPYPCTTGCPLATDPRLQSVA